MSLHSRDPILLTPGPLTTSLPTKMAMLRDWGSWDAQFNAVTAEVRRKLTDIVHARETHTCVPMQGSGTFAIEAVVNTLVPRAGHVLVLINGAYGKRFAKLAQMMGRRLSTFETADDVPTTADDVERML
jgi:2-aminoethylphosphonate-pyruvate transaminase